MDPVAEGMLLVNEPHAALMLGTGLLGLGAFGARRRSA
jgi:MYXO-CTERM domain-containing protein